jgi:hypothetical protein
MLEERLQRAGLGTVVEWFSYDIRPAELALGLVLVTSALLVAAAGLIAARSAVLGLVLLAAAALPGAVFLAWSPWLEKLYRREGGTRTANLTGRRPASSGPRLRLIVMAHHDSKSQSLTFPYRMGFTLVGIIGVLGLAVVLGIALAAGAAPGPGWLPAALGGVAAVAALGLSTMRSGNRSPGGVDNAGSVAILLELARSIPDEAPADVELVFLSTGAEEDHMVGAMRWLDAHAEELKGRPVYCLNFDGAGAPGRLVLIERFGFGRRFSERMSAAARRAAGRLGLPVRGIVMLPGLGIDAIPFAHRGIDCITVASGSLGKATMSVHSAGDRAEHLNAATLADAVLLARELIRDLIQTGRGGSVQE